MVLCDSLERVVEEGHRSVCEDWINVFDQTRINSSFQRPPASDRPLMVKLQKAMWRRYAGI